MVIINESQKDAFFKITNDNCYFEDNFDNILSKKTTNKIYLEVINNNCFIINKKKYIKN